MYKHVLLLFFLLNNFLINFDLNLTFLTLYFIAYKLIITVLRN